MTIAVDFDGTIVEHEYPKIGKLKPNAKETINKWYEQGHKIIIWSCRYDEGIQEVIDFLNDNKIKFHTFNKNVDLDDNFDPYPKIYADLYIDDRGFRFTDDKYNWEYLNRKI